MPHSALTFKEIRAQSVLRCICNRLRSAAPSRLSSVLNAGVRRFERRSHAKDTDPRAPNLVLPDNFGSATGASRRDAREVQGPICHITSSVSAGTGKRVISRATDYYREQRFLRSGSQARSVARVLAKSPSGRSTANVVGRRVRRGREGIARITCRIQCGRTRRPRPEPLIMLVLDKFTEK